MTSFELEAIIKQHHDDDITTNVLLRAMAEALVQLLKEVYA